MTKKFILGLGLISLLVTSTVFAKSDPEGTPFQAVWDAINALKNQIQNIQLIPGPQGLRGDKGDPGTPNWDEARIVSLEARVAALESTGQTCTAVLCENFNSFNLGQIVGQSGWIDRESGSLWHVEGSIFQEGNQAISNFHPTGESIITKNTGTALLDGRQTFYVRTESHTNWTSFWSYNVSVGMYQGSWDGSARAVVGFLPDGTFSYIGPSGQVALGTYVDNAWNQVDIEWRSSDKTARYRLNNGNWSEWVPFHAEGTFTGFDTVGIDGAYLGTGGVYVDNLR